MKTVNMLPEWYRAAQREKNSLRWRIVLLVLLGGAMCVWSMLGQRELALLQAQRDQLTPPGELASDCTPDLARQQAQLRRLETLKLAYQDLGRPVPMSTLVQQVQNNMTPGMALSHLTVDVRNEPVRGSGPVGDSAHPPRYHRVARFTVVGIAPNDVLIAQLIGKLSANPLFSDLTLNYTRTEILLDYSIRRFEIQMQVDLDRLGTDRAAPTQQARAREAKHAT